jgi:hypothetical protein
MPFVLYRTLLAEVLGWSQDFRYPVGVARVRHFTEPEGTEQCFLPNIGGEFSHSEFSRATEEPNPRKHYLMLADIALASAREEQRRIKEKIRPHVERYRRITGNKH